jgi:hypothetical protein
VSNEEWNSCFEIKQEIKDTIIGTLRARGNTKVIPS